MDDSITAWRIDVQHAHQNLFGTLFEMPRLWLANRNVLHGTSEQIPVDIENTSSDTSGSNIYSNEAPLCHRNEQQVNAFVDTRWLHVQKSDGHSLLPSLIAVLLHVYNEL